MCVGGRGVVDSESHVAPAPPPTNPEKPALPVTLPLPSPWTLESRASGPQIQLLAPPKAPQSCSWPPLLVPELRRWPSLAQPGTVPPRFKNLGFPLPPKPRRKGGGVTKSKGSLPNPRVRGAGYCGNKPLPAKQKQGVRQGLTHKAQKGRHTQAKAQRTRVP